MIEVVETTLEHIRVINKTLRNKDYQEAINQGLVPHKAVFNSFRSAVYRKTVLVDEVVAAIFGITGSLLNIENGLYFITGEVANQVSPITFARVYMQELEKLLNIFPKLTCTIDDSYREAIRLAEFAGFSKEQGFKINDNEFSIYSIEKKD